MRTRMEKEEAGSYWRAQNESQAKSGEEGGGRRIKNFPWSFVFSFSLPEFLFFAFSFSVPAPAAGGGGERRNRDFFALPSILLKFFHSLRCHAHFVSLLVPVWDGGRSLFQDVDEEVGGKRE